MEKIRYARQEKGSVYYFCVGEGSEKVYGPLSLSDCLQALRTRLSFGIQQRENLEFIYDSEILNFRKSQRK